MPTGERGSVYLWLLGVLVVVGVMLGKAVDLASTRAERQREVQLMQVGDAYRRAISSYVQAPGADGRLPQQLTDLLLDPRFVQPVHHLRQLYRDPETGGELELIRDEQQGIAGVYSASTRAPHKQRDFPARYQQFEKAERLADWQFIYTRADSKTP
ncbi:hypothetical protein [Chitinimonas naiadis]